MVTTKKGIYKDVKLACLVKLNIFKFSVVYVPTYVRVN